MEDEDEEHDEILKIEHLHKCRNYLFGFCKLVVYNVLTSVSRNRRKFTNNMHEQDKIAVTQFFQEVYLETVKRVSRRGKEWEPLLIYINS
jgi:hypothetical protein